MAKITKFQWIVLCTPLTWIIATALGIEDGALLCLIYSIPPVAIATLVIKNDNQRSVIIAGILAFSLVVIFSAISVLFPSTENLFVMFAALWWGVVSLADPEAFT